LSNQPGIANDWKASWSMEIGRIRKSSVKSS